MTTAAEDDWVELAARDDHLVAEMLLRLRRAVPPPRKSAPGPALPLDWRVRQPRSGAPKEKENKKGKKNKQKQLEAVEPTRASPSTPLSWSGATSTSGGCADGPEESSRPARPPYNAGSKVSIFTATANSTTPTTRRAKRKKTSAELKEEESLLLKERRNLRHELAALCLTLAQERAKNEIFKRERHDLQLQHAKTVAARDVTADHEPQEPLPKSRDNINAVAQQTPPTDNISTPSKVEMHEMMFELPDLNVPVEEHCGP